MLHARYLVAIVALVGGCGPDCFDAGILEAAYREGERLAQEINRIAHDRGVADGLALTRPDGERDGERKGYSDGYRGGYDDAWLVGHRDGYLRGLDTGAADTTACSAGAAAGVASGSTDGYRTAFDAGFAEGTRIGYDAGWLDGNGDCGAPDIARVAPRATVEEPPSKDERVCRALGYDELFDPGARDRGLEEGKRANPDYLGGFDATYPTALARGRADGFEAGYVDGYDRGYGAGHADGYAVVYDGCFNTAYSDAYVTGYRLGFDPGYSAGYGAGYSSGYGDGASACP
jgi:flagellar biosynthesis/type III secretory pathway protein FliH